MLAQLKPVIKAPNEQIPFTDSRIKYPMFGSVKYDGFRGLLINGRFRSPKLKPYGNKHIEEKFAEIVSLSNAGMVFDTEIWHPEITFSQLQSRLTAHEGDLDGFQCHVFDFVNNENWNSGQHHTFAERYRTLSAAFEYITDKNIILVKQQLLLGASGAETYYNKLLASGCEGIILRSPHGTYKNNRCTHNESNMYKFKNFVTYDAKIVEVVQRRKLRDDAERTHDPVGYLERVNTASSYDLDEAVGSLTVEYEGVRFNCNLGRGFSYDDRKRLWVNSHDIIGKHVEFKYMPHGTKDKPRIGSIVRFRPDKD